MKNKFSNTLCNSWAVLNYCRVTCRDWFQLSLKEGLTVFRDQVKSNFPYSGHIYIKFDIVSEIWNQDLFDFAGVLIWYGQSYS